MTIALEDRALSANEAACVTDIPLKQVHRFIDAGLLGDAVNIRKGARIVPATVLVGLKLAEATAGILTLEGRRRLVRRLLDDPEAKTIREDAVSVDVRPMKREVRRGLANLATAKKMIAIDKEVLGGVPCFKGTRIAVHDIADMLANGGDVSAVLAAYPALNDRQVAAAAIYAKAYPRRGRPRREPAWRKAGQRASKEVKLERPVRAS